MSFNSASPSNQYIAELTQDLNALREQLEVLTELNAALKQDNAARKWQPIDQVPLDGTEVMLTCWNEETGEYTLTDFGCWDKVDEDEVTNTPVMGWLTVNGEIDTPTHFMYVDDPEPSEEDTEDDEASDGEEGGSVDVAESD